jgi:hypothetical protein
MNGLKLRARLCKTAIPIASIIVITAVACTPRSGLQISGSPEQSPIQSERGDPMRQVRTFSTQSHARSQSAQSSSQSTSQHRSSLNLRSSELRQPHILAIATSGTAMTGQITLDGEMIQQIKETRTEINLAPYLSVGQHTLEISVSYTPASASMSVGFTAPGTQVMNQTSGNGRMSHIFNIRVD